jgi:sulfonate transport system permease protein
VVLAGVLVVGAVGLLMDLVMRRIECGLGGRSSETEVGAVVPRGVFSWRLSLLLPLGLALLWTLSVELAWVDARLLPPIERILLAGFDPVVLKLVVGGLGATLWRNLEGALLGCLAGLLFGALLGASPLAQRLFGPGFHVFRQVAMFAWIPLLTAWFGIGETMRVLFIAIAAFKPMAVNTQIGVSHVQQQYLEVGRTMQLRGWRLVHKVVLPAALPTIVTGLQLAFISSWLATVGVETLVSFTVGIGSVLREGEEHFHMHVVMFGIVLIGCMGFLFNVVLNQASRRLLAWREVRG